MTITHTKVSAIADSGDATLVEPSDWNAAHVIANNTVTEAQLLIADNTTGNVSTSAHGFAPKITNTANFLKGDGTWASPGTNSGPTFPCGIPLTSMKYRSAFGSNLPTGDNDLTFTEGGSATVPAGKRWLINIISVWNSSIGNITWFPEIKISGVYFRLIANQGPTPTLAAAATTVGYIAEAGETLAVNVATNNGLNVYYTVIEFDNTIGLRSAKLTSLAAGDNTVYTVTAGKTGFLLPGLSMTVLNNSGSLNYANSSGVNRTILWNIVPNGNVVGTGNQMTGSSVVPDKGKSNLSFPATLSAGDFISINTDANTATQMAWVNVMETS